MILAFINFYDTNYRIILHKILLEKLAKLIPRGHAPVYIVDHLGSNQIKGAKAPVIPFKNKNNNSVSLSLSLSIYLSLSLSPTLFLSRFISLPPSFSLSLSLSLFISLFLSLTGEEGVRTLFTGQRQRQREREREIEKERGREREIKRERMS